MPTSDPEAPAGPPPSPGRPGRAPRLERAFEAALWQSRYALVVAVVASVGLWLAMLLITTVDVIAVLGRVAAYATADLTAAERTAARRDLLADVVGAVDGYLIASALFIFTLGLYRQFVSRIEAAEATESGARLLDLASFHDLKGHLARMVVLVLLVKFLQEALQASYAGPLDLLLLAAGTLLAGGATYLTHLTQRSSD